VPDLTWFSPDLGEPAWGEPNARTLCYQLDTSEHGADSDAHRLFVILNGHYESQWVTLPSLAGQKWYRAIDTSLPGPNDFVDPGDEIPLDPTDHYIANSRSTVVLIAR
jgi:glycogen operon protein